MDAYASLLEELLAAGPSPDTTCVLLKKLKEVAEPSRVIRHGEEAVRRHPDHVGLRTLLSEIHLGRNQVGMAEIHAEKAAALLQEQASVFKLQARIHQRQGSTIKAEECLRKFLAHHPRDPEALRFLEELSATHDAPPAPKEVSTPGVMDTEAPPRPLEGPGTGARAERPLSPESPLAGTSLAPSNSEYEAAAREARRQEKKERMIQVLEGWLSRIREEGHGR